MADLSGPMNYLDAEIYTAGKHITIPSFFAVAPGDDVVSATELESLAGDIHSPAPILHLDGDGHGWDLLHSSTNRGAFNPLADQLVAFIQGTPAG